MFTGGSGAAYSEAQFKPLILTFLPQDTGNLSSEACLAGVLSVCIFSDLCCHQWSLSPLEGVQRRDRWPGFHGAGEDPASCRISSPRAVVSLVQQGPANTYFRIFPSGAKCCVG